MLRFTCILFGLSFTLSSFAAPKFYQIKQEVAIREVSVEASNGGFNPDFSAYIIKGQVMLASNPCRAQGLTASLQIKQVGQGKQHLVAMIKGRQRADRICTAEFEPVFVEVATTVRGEGSFIDSVFVRNLDELGTLRSLSSLMISESSCEQKTFCTREYRPATCVMGDVEFKASNGCEALRKVRRFACLNSIEYAVDDVVCTFDAPRF
jgi:hypothetical protein